MPAKHLDEDQHRQATVQQLRQEKERLLDVKKKAEKEQALAIALKAKSALENEINSLHDELHSALDAETKAQYTIIELKAKLASLTD
jgi:hypothetical protein